MSNRVIYFHDVHDKEWFEKTLLVFIDNFTMVSIKDLEGYFYKKKKLKNTCHITVDDGDKTFYTVIYPLLKKYNIPATLFVSPKICLNQENYWFQEISEFEEKKLYNVVSEYLSIDYKKLIQYPIKSILKNLKIRYITEIISLYKKKYNSSDIECKNMGVDELLEVDKEGLVAIGAHTMNHPILANEDNEVSKLEIEKSFDELEHILGHEIKYFAYPNGIPGLDFGEREKMYLKEKGCKLSFSTKNGNISKRMDTMAISRLSFSRRSKYDFLRTRLLIKPYQEIYKSMKTKTKKDERFELKNMIMHT